MNYTQIEVASRELAEKLIKISMKDYFKQVVDKFYSDYDISFMEYFLELSKANQNEFVVHQSKLEEYGIAANGESVKANLNSFRLVEEVDYQLADLTEHYYLTPTSIQKMFNASSVSTNKLL